MYVTSLLCGPRADLWPFYGFLWQRFSLYKGKPTAMALMDYSGIHRSRGCLTDRATLSVSGFLVYANN